MKKKFIFILFLIVLISYGQLLGMYVWQDDNGLFFKLAHIDERAGYLGPGSFGAGAYKYIVTPYIWIYKIFGYNTVPYFFLAIICYFLAAVVIYKVSSVILGERAGRVSGFLWAAGYIASDGFIRLFNTVITSFSVVSVSLLTFSYWKFFKEKKYKWYFLAVLFYFLSIEFARGRTHYLVSAVVFFEFLFFAFKKPIVRSIIMSIVRLLPFLFIFYHYFILNADSRSGNIGKFVIALTNGEYYQVYGFLSSVSNALIPEWFVSRIFQIKPTYVWLVAIFIAILFILKIFRNSSRRRFLLPIAIILFFVWVFVSRSIFLVPVLNLGTSQVFTAFLGGVIILLSVSYCFVIEKNFKKLYLFFLIWFFANIGAYSAYNPTFAYETVNRYLAHSFFAMVLVGGLLYKVNVKNKIVAVFIILWGVSNIINSVFYQNNIIKNRSTPPRNFYGELKVYMPKVEKGDVIYFDVSQDARSYFADAFSVASMPETTAIAWRYGIDRYDFEMFTDFTKFEDFVVLKKIPPGKVYSFRYEKSGLIDTSQELRRLLFKGEGKREVQFENKDGVLAFKNPISSVVPINMMLHLSSTPKFVPGDNLVSRNKDSFVSMAFEYLRFKNSILERAKYFATSSWQDRVIGNIHDKDNNTLWQPDRILWHKGEESFTIDMGRTDEVNRFVWVNGFGNNTPTKYVVETSLDNTNWQMAKTVDSIMRVDSHTPQIVKFESRRARFVRMKLVASLNGDSPGISEAWVVLTSLSNIDVIDVEKFIQRPFTNVNSLADFKNLLSILRYMGTMQVYWNDSEGNWVTKFNNKINVVYDDMVHSYMIVIPAGGLEIGKLKLSDFMIPGEVDVKKVEVYYQAINE